MFGFISNDVSPWYAGDFGFLKDWYVETLLQQSFPSDWHSKTDLFALQGAGVRPASLEAPGAAGLLHFLSRSHWALWEGSRYYLLKAFLFYSISLLGDSGKLKGSYAFKVFCRTCSLCSLDQVICCRREAVLFGFDLLSLFHLSFKNTVGIPLFWKNTWDNPLERGSICLDHSFRGFHPIGWLAL